MGTGIPDLIDVPSGSLILPTLGAVFDKHLSITVTVEGGVDDFQSVRKGTRHPKREQNLRFASSMRDLVQPGGHYPSLYVIEIPLAGVSLQAIANYLEDFKLAGVPCVFWLEDESGESKLLSLIQSQLKSVTFHTYCAKYFSNMEKDNAGLGKPQSVGSFVFLCRMVLVRAKHPYVSVRGNKDIRFRQMVLPGIFHFILDVLGRAIQYQLQAQAIVLFDSCRRWSRDVIIDMAVHVAESAPKWNVRFTTPSVGKIT